MQIIIVITKNLLLFNYYKTKKQMNVLCLMFLENIYYMRLKNNNNNIKNKHINIIFLVI
jgi:hypothetical protein